MKPPVLSADQRQMLDHTMRRVANAGLANVHPAHADAQELPYEDASFDAVVLITVLGEVPNQERALAEIARVLRPDGRLVVGEVLGDPHYVTVGTLQRKAEDAGLRFERRHGTVAGYFARLAH